MWWTMWLAVSAFFGGPEAAFSPSGDWLQYETPEEAGFSSAAIEEGFAMAEQGRTAAFMAIYRGRVLAAWGFVDSRYKCHSVRKSLYSALYGIYRDEGLVDLSKSLAELGIDDLDGLTDIEKRATVKDLISARSGVYHPATKEPASMKENRPERGSHPPGTHFWYNNWDFNTSAFILEKMSGVGVFDAFRDRLARPLGMQDFRMRDGFAEYDRSASRYPAPAFRLSARDMARFGQLYLQNGIWNGKRILSEAWIRESTSTLSDDERGGYGYMWWVFEKGSLQGFPELTAFLAAGAGGQSIFVCPDAEMVLVHRGDTDHNRYARFGDVLGFFQKIWEGRVGEPKKNPRTVPMKAIPLSDRLPAIEDREPISLSSEALNVLTGKYELQEGMAATVRALEDRLVIAHPLHGEMDFFPESPTDFFSWNSNIQLHFIKNEEGRPTVVEVNQFGQKLRCPRIE